MEKQTIYCPGCQQKYLIDANAKKGSLRCNKCNQVFRLEECLAGTDDVSDLFDDEFGPPIAPKPVVAEPAVAQVVVAEQNSIKQKHRIDVETNRDWLVPVVVAVLFLSVASLGGLLLWKQNDGRNDVVAGAGGNQIAQSFVGNSFDRDAVAKPVNSGVRKRPASKPDSSSGQSKFSSHHSKLKFDFPTANWVHYTYTLKGGTGPSDFRHVSFNGRTSYKRYRKGEVSDEAFRYDGLELSQYDRLGYEAPSFGGLSNKLGTPFGYFLVDSELQPKSDWSLDSEELVPFLVLPTSRVGVIPLGDGKSKWTDRREVVIGNPSKIGRLGRSRVSRSGFASPRALPDIPNQNVFDIGGRIPGFDRPFKSLTLKRDVDYEIKSQSNDVTEIAARLVAKTTGNDPSSLRLTVKCTGVIRFDNKSRILLSQDWTGNAILTDNQSTDDLPIEFNCKLDPLNKSMVASNSPMSPSKRSNLPGSSPDPFNDNNEPNKSAIDHLKKSREKFDELIDQHLADGHAGAQAAEIDELRDRMNTMMDQHLRGSARSNPFESNKPRATHRTSTAESISKAKPNSKTVRASPASKSKISKSHNGVTNPIFASDEMGWGIDSLSFANSGELYAGEMDRAISVFDVNNGVRLDQKVALNDIGQVQVSKITPNGKYLLTGSSNGRLEIWAIGKDGKLKLRDTFNGHKDKVCSIAVSPDSRFVFSGSGGSQRLAILWELSTGQQKCAIDGFTHDVLATAFSKGGKYVVASDGDTVLKADGSTGSLLRTQKLGNRFCHSAEFSPDAEVVAVSVGREVKLYDVDSLQLHSELNCEHTQWSLKFGPSGKYLYTGCDRVVVRWDWKQEDKIGEFAVSENTNISAIAISSDEKYLAAIGSSAGQKLKVFEIPTN